jgi:hypothetical protein
MCSCFLTFKNGIVRKSFFFLCHFAHFNLLFHQSHNWTTMHKKGLKDTRLVACTLAPFLINSNYLDIFIQFTLRWENWLVLPRGLLCLTRWTSLSSFDPFFPIDFLQKNNLPNRCKKSCIMLIYNLIKPKRTLHIWVVCDKPIIVAHEQFWH